MEMKKGFTLAETLIAMAIIGVVAALTIPAFLQKKEKRENLTRLKKAYSQINETLKIMTDDKDCLDNLACTGIFENDTATAGAEIAKYFKVLKNCGVDEEGCFSASVNDAFDGTGNDNNMTEDGGYKFITADGMSVAIYDSGSGCANDNSVTGSGPMSQMCGRMVIDTNGPNKGPNNFGKDLYMFYITNGKGTLIYPVGGSDDGATPQALLFKDGDGNIVSCSEDNPTAYSCAARIMEEGWAINYYGGSSASSGGPKVELPTENLHDCDESCPWNETYQACTCY